MLLLSIDTSGRQGSVGLARAGENDSPSQIEMVEIMPLVGGAFSAELIPQISTLISSNGYTKEAIGAFAVVSGPGSFTGLRVGLAAVKALAEILAKPMAAVSMLEVCAIASGVQGKVMAVLDAGRGDVYLGGYEVLSIVPEQPKAISSEQLLPRADFLARAEGWNVVTPDPTIAEAARAAGVQVSTIMQISAADVARLGWSKIKAGDTVSAMQLEANYIRRTDAEILEKSRS
jgi:tRNA threonylcarbamoyladenosine biosynthesis protein TsaB